MDKTTLVDKYITDGKILIKALESGDFAVDTAMWFYSEESDEWQLLIATPIVEENGPKEAYRQIQAILADLPSFSISLRDISVLSPSNSLISTIKSAVRHSRDIILKGAVINGTLINDAYIYCVA